jgi:deoxycytidylate deaminase
MHQYLKLAVKQALNHEYDEGIQYKLCAVLVKGGNVVSIGFNQRKTNAFVEHYTDRVRGGGRSYCLSTHAEMSCVIQARNSTDLTGCKIYVARIRSDRSNHGITGMAMPCPICRNVLLSYGIKKACYTIDDNNYGVMKVTEANIDPNTLKNYDKDQV